MNVMFKRGTQADLLQYINGTKQAVEGSFYLTTDSNRLYIGKQDPADTSKVKAFPVNQGVITVDALGNLPSRTSIEAGQFYYVKNDNILCIYNGMKWVQINPDTNTYIDSREIKGSTSTITENGTTYEFAVVTDIIEDVIESGGNKDENETYTSKFAVDGRNGINVSVSTFTDGGKTYPRLVISQAEQTFTATAAGDNINATIKLSDGNKDTEFGLEGSSNVMIKAGSAANKIKIESINSNMDSASGAKVTNAFDANGGFTTTVADSDGNSAKSAAVTPKINYGHDEDGTTTASATFKSGTAVLDIYTASQIDSKLRGVNAMVYRGTVGTGGTVSILPTSNVSIGDTYKVVSNNSIAHASAYEGFCRIGDVLIATSKSNKEGSDGYIASGDLAWDYIPSGDDSQIDTQYFTKAIASGSLLMQDDGANGISKGGFSLETEDSEDPADVATYLEIGNDSSINANAKNVQNRIVIKHKEQANISAPGQTYADTLEATQSYDPEETTYFNITVPVLGYDKAGHITSVANKTYKLLDTHQTYELQYLKSTTATSTYSEDNTAKKGTLSASGTIEVALKDMNKGDTIKKNFTVNSNTLFLSSNGTNLSIDIEWGTF